MPLAAVKFADSIQQGLNSFIGFIPNVIGFLIILLIGYIIAKVVKTAITKGLQALKVDRHLHDSDAGQYVERVSPGPYVELFARSPRLGWDSWGHGWEQVA